MLGKKSWNVYNQDNIDKVRRDEELARAAEQETERRQRDNDAADRLTLLRGDDAPDQQLATQGTYERKRKRDAQDDHSNAREDLSKSGHSRSKNDSRIHVSDDPLDHISNMRFRDAAGRGPDAQKPWYNGLASDHPTPATGRDVWGNEDAGRQARDQRRLDTSDPLLFMKKGVKQLRQVEKQKSEWRQERERDLHEVEELARRERHRRRKEDRHRHNRDGDRDKHGRRKRHRSRSRSPERDRRGRP